MSDPHGTIVVGVDGSGDSDRALDWAIAEAKCHDAPILLVHGIDVGLSAADPYGGGYVLDQLQEGAQAAVDRAAKRCAEAGVESSSHIQVGSPSYALVEASKTAAMVVVGSRGHGGFAELLLGSVSAACVHHARCPVVVIPRPYDGEPRGLTLLASPA